MSLTFGFAIAILAYAWVGSGEEYIRLAGTSDFVAQMLGTALEAVILTLMYPEGKVCT